MDKETILTGVLIERTATLTLIEVCDKYHIPKELLIEMLDEGLFSNQSTQPEAIALDQNALRRIEIAFRLHKDLELNLPGVVLAIELLEELGKMNDELAILRKHFQG